MSLKNHLIGNCKIFYFRSPYFYYTAKHEDFFVVLRVLFPTINITRKNTKSLFTFNSCLYSPAGIYIKKEFKLL